MTKEPETGTLAELNVKPGDVVKAANDTRLWGRGEKTITPEGWISDNDGDFWGPGTRYDGYPMMADFRIVSRAHQANAEGWSEWASTSEWNTSKHDVQMECVDGIHRVRTRLRIRPEPKRETVAIGYPDDHGNWHEIGTIELEDGQPDPASIRMEQI